MDTKTMKSSTTSTAPKSESVFVRFLLALPLFGLFCLARAVLQANVAQYLPLLEESAKTGWIDDGGNLVPLRTTYSGIEAIDSFLAIFVGFFTPALAGLDHSFIPGAQLGEHGMLYAPQRLQTITFLADVTALIAICTLESCRPGNARTVAAFPSIFLLAGQLLGGGQVMPLFYFLTYALSPPQLGMSTNRTVPSHYARTILLALAFGYMLPTLLTFYPTTLSTQQGWNGIWQLYPLWTPLFHHLFSYLPFSSSQKPGNALSSLRIAYALLILLSATTYIVTFLVSPVPFPQLFFAELSPWSWNAAVQSVSHGTAMFLKWDEVFVMLATTYWMMLQVRHLKRQGWAEYGWGTILVSFVGAAVVFGPGAAMAALWWYREEVLAAVDEGKKRVE